MTEALEELLQDVDIPVADDAFVLAVMRRIQEQRSAADRTHALVLVAILAISAASGMFALTLLLPSATLVAIMQTQNTIIYWVSAAGCIWASTRAFISLGKAREALVLR